MVDVVLGMVLVALGGLAGWFLRGIEERAKRLSPEPETPGTQEVQRMQAERQAFEALMGYNAETAYGMQDKEG